ncbi:MAG: hypothetical protein P1P86_06765 [Bacteroidales bacterium]|nr:hypothetical protein [Bacteroidales bacterium]
MKISFIKRKEIQVEKWDHLIAGSTAETLYPYSWYLDAVAENWSALVAEDYRFVMPVVWKKKAGMKYIYQPFYTQQLGVFSREYVEPELIRKMLHILYKKFRFAGMNLNTRNLVGEEAPFTVDDKSNYIMTLFKDYDTLARGYSSNAGRNIKKSTELSEVIERSLPVEELVRLKMENDVIRRSREDYRWMLDLFETILQRGAGKIYAVRREREITSAAFFAFSRTRAIYLLSASSQEGKEQRGMFRIVDAFIRDHAGSGLILDFEGSNIPSVARFFAGFGAQAEIYQGVSFSRLPATLTRLR